MSKAGIEKIARSALDSLDKAVAHSLELEVKLAKAKEGLKEAEQLISYWETLSAREGFQGSQYKCKEWREKYGEKK